LRLSSSPHTTRPRSRGTREPRAPPPTKSQLGVRIGPSGAAPPSGAEDRDPPNRFSCLIGAAKLSSEGENLVVRQISRSRVSYYATILKYIHAECFCLDSHPCMNVHLGLFPSKNTLLFGEGCPPKNPPEENPEGGPPKSRSCLAGAALRRILRKRIRRAASKITLLFGAHALPEDPPEAPSGRRRGTAEPAPGQA
jgi:hypothetical protein